MFTNDVVVLLGKEAKVRGGEAEAQLNAYNADDDDDDDDDDECERSYHTASWLGVMVAKADKVGDEGAVAVRGNDDDDELAVCCCCCCCWCRVVVVDEGSEEGNSARFE